MPPVPPHIAARPARPARHVPAPATARSHDGTIAKAWASAGGALTISLIAADGTEVAAAFTEAETARLLADVEARRRAAAA